MDVELQFLSILMGIVRECISKVLTKFDTDAITVTAATVKIKDGTNL